MGAFDHREDGGEMGRERSLFPRLGQMPPGYTMLPFLTVQAFQNIKNIYCFIARGRVYARVAESTHSVCFHSPIYKT